MVVWILLGTIVVIVSSVVARRIARRRLRLDLRAQWAQPVDRDRDMDPIASYHLALAGGDADAPSLDDRTWIDLNLDEVFAVLDRTHSSVGQQVLYRRLRTTPVAEPLEAFEALAARMEADAPLRERAQLALCRLSDKAGYDLWSLAQPDLLKPEPWFVLFPVITAAMIASLAAAPFWPQALVFLAAGAVVSIATRLFVASYMPLVLGPFRQLGPLIAAAAELSSMGVAGAEPITATLAPDVARLTRLRRIAAWVSRDTSSSLDLSSIVVEYLNILLLFDANALYFGARELRDRSGELMRAIAAVGEVDAAISVASYRAGTPGWTRPVFVERLEQAALTAIRHPLVPDAVPNSILLGPPRGVIVTGSNMSGKSTFLRTVGVTIVMAQTINTCLAESYRAPVFIVRSCIGRSDDLIAGKSYYIVEVESVLSRVVDSQQSAPHLFLFDELFRGTNAVERIAAGEAVLAELVRPHGDQPSPHVTLAATHDQELVDLLSDDYAPFHFADTVGESGLMFSYQLQSGPATTRNAITLLRLNGAPPDLVERALSRAAALDRDRTRWAHRPDGAAGAAKV